VEYSSHATASIQSGENGLLSSKYPNGINHGLVFSENPHKNEN